MFFHAGRCGFVCCALLSLLALAWPCTSAANFGEEASDGLVRVRTGETVGMGAMRLHLDQGFYRQEVGQESRIYQMLTRLNFTLGLGEIGQFGVTTRTHERLYTAAPADTLLYNSIGDWHFKVGYGDVDLALKLVLPLPIPRLQLAAHGALRVPVGGESNIFSAGERDYEVLGIASLLILDGSRFVKTRLHLNAGMRGNRNPAGHGLAPTLDITQEGSPFPPYYPPLEEGEYQDSRQAVLYGAGLEFTGRNNIVICGELTYDYLSNLRDRMTIAENPLYLGLGIKFLLPLRLKLGGSANICLSRDDFGTDFEPHYPRIIANIGIQWTWQMLAGDEDGDGIRGSDDLCPDRPEDMDGFQDRDGCPDPDNDLDGVPDLIDLAPLLPEDFDGFEDEDGRPDLDNDNDGIPDRQDLCPDRPEDFDGIEDEDGCPDREEDGGAGQAAPGEAPPGDEAPPGEASP